METETREIIIDGVPTGNTVTMPKGTNEEAWAFALLQPGVPTEPFSDNQGE